jgi:exodeoxyribonuclease VII small subunit
LQSGNDFGYSRNGIGKHTTPARTLCLSQIQMSEPIVPADIASMSFEDALAELEQIVRRLEAGQVKLDEAILCYERGTQLKRHCERKLNEAQQRVDRIVIGPDGAVSVTPAKLD